MSTSSSEFPPWAVLDQSIDKCPPGLSNCSVEIVDGIPRMHIRGLHLVAQGPFSPLVFDGFRGHILIENFTLEGYFTGIYWHASDPYNPCVSCRAELRNGTIQHPSEPPAGCLDFECPARGLPAATAIYVNFGLDSGKISLDSLRIIDYDSSIQVSAKEVSIRGVEAQGLSGCPHATAYGSAALSVVDVNIVGKCAALAIGGTVGGTSIWRNVTVTNLEPGTPPPFGGPSVLSYARGKLDIDELHVKGSNGWGFEIEGATGFSIRNSTFIDNGNSQPFHSAIHVSSAGTGPYEIHNSHFEGNMMAVRSDGAIVNASNNYWGSPNGPTLWPSANSSPPPKNATGDYVNENIVFVPWLQSPP